MTPGIPQLDPIPLAAPVAVFWLLLLLTFTLHLLPMSAVLGGSIIAAVSRRLGAGGHAHHAELARLAGKLLPVCIAAAVTLGVAALLFLQVLYGRVFFSSAVVMAWFWLAVVPLLIVAYYAAYGVAFKSGGTGVALAWTAAALFATIAFIYSNNMTLMLQPDVQHALYVESARGLQLNLGDPTLPPRYLHMLAGALGIGGLAVALVGLVRRRSAPEFGRWAVKYGVTWFVWATLANIAVGLWFLAVLPGSVIARFMGRDFYATIVLALGIAVAVAALGFARMAQTAREPARPLAAAWGAAILTVVFMVLTRDTIRTVLLEEAGLRPATWVAPQWGPIAMFGVLLVAAIALVAWMVAALVRAAPAASPAARADTAQV